MSTFSLFHMFSVCVYAVRMVDKDRWYTCQGDFVNIAVQDDYASSDPGDYVYAGCHCSSAFGELSTCKA